MEKINTGVACIKKEYILPSNPVTIKNCGEETDADKNGNRCESLPKAKRLKTSGQNRNRPKLFREPRDKKLCRSYWSLLPKEHTNDGICSYSDCRFSHDISTFLNNKPEDLGDVCHNFEAFGYCPNGVMCRFGKNHIEDCGSKRDEKLYNEYIKNPPTKNFLDKEVQSALRKKKYDFNKSSSLLKTPNKNQEKNTSEISCNDEVNTNTEYNRSENDSIPLHADDCIKYYDVSSKKKIDWSGKLYLAPLTTLGNLPFRRICKQFGADITCSEMALSSCLLQGSPSEWALMKRHSSEDLFGVQLCGSNVGSMIRCSQLLDEQIDLDFIDINMGCPIDLIYKQGGGSALMRRSGTVEQMVQSMSKVAKCPITLKMRTGVYRNANVAHSLIAQAKNWGVSQITLHGRSREQRFVKLANWEYISECSKVAAPLPLFGNGDVLTYEDYYSRMEDTNLSGIMIARGALIKPWIFTEIKEKRNWDISASERLDIVKEYVNFGLEHWGSDSEGVEKTRRFLLEWLSFLYRYIPIGLLDQTQEINQRPPPYFGRSDLETLLASNKVNDWVKISEMFLGRVPENFSFLPKHQANCWV